MFLFHHSSQVESAPVTEPDPIGNAVPGADILERKNSESTKTAVKERIRSVRSLFLSAYLS